MDEELMKLLTEYSRKSGWSVTDLLLLCTATGTGANELYKQLQERLGVNVNEK